MKYDWEKIAAEYRRSGLSQTQYAKLRGISSSTLSKRIRELDINTSPNGKINEGASFIEIGTTERIEVEVIGLFKVYLREKQLVSLIRSLRD